MMNKVFLIGNLTRVPEMRATQSGIEVCNFSIAVNRRKDANGNQPTDYFNIVAWRQLATLCGKFLMKGKKVAIVGSIQQRSFTDKDGIKRTAFDIVADEVEFLTPMGEAPGTRNTEQNVPAAPPVQEAAFEQVDDEDLPF